MKNSYFLIPHLILIFFLQSCQEKKLIEVVEVPLPEKSKNTLIIGNPDEVKANEGFFPLEKLPYKYNDLNPNISSKTLEIHYAKYYLNFTNNLNKILKENNLPKLTIEQLLGGLELKDESLRNNAGGYYNHSLYFKCISEKSYELPQDTLAGAIDKEFGTYDNFLKKFKDVAIKQFGSGWVWLVVDKKGKLQITSTENQDNPLMKHVLVKGTPILALDLWEHAYFLDYENKKHNYIDDFLNIVNWKKVEENYEATLKK